MFSSYQHVVACYVGQNLRIESGMVDCAPTTPLSSVTHIMLMQSKQQIVANITKYVLSVNIGRLLYP